MFLFFAAFPWWRVLILQDGCQPLTTQLPWVTVNLPPAWQSFVFLFLFELFPVWGAPLLPMSVRVGWWVDQSRTSFVSFSVIVPRSGAAFLLSTGRCCATDAAFPSSTSTAWTCFIRPIPRSPAGDFANGSSISASRALRFFLIACAWWATKRRDGRCRWELPAVASAKITFSADCYRGTVGAILSVRVSTAFRGPTPLPGPLWCAAIFPRNRWQRVCWWIPVLVFWTCIRPCCEIARLWRANYAQVLTSFPLARCALPSEAPPPLSPLGDDSPPHVVVLPYFFHPTANDKLPTRFCCQNCLGSCLKPPSKPWPVQTVPCSSSSLWCTHRAIRNTLCGSPWSRSPVFAAGYCRGSWGECVYFSITCAWLCCCWVISGTSGWRAVCGRSWTWGCIRAADAPRAWSGPILPAAAWR